MQSKIDLLAKRFEDQISLPWPQHLTSDEKTIFIVYPKDEERRLRAKMDIFKLACENTGHGWRSVSLDNAFADWMSSQEYATDYFQFPEDITQKLETDFTAHAAKMIRDTLAATAPNDVVAVLGVGALFGFAHVSAVLKKIESPIPGRLAIFFPGSYDKNVYRLLDARDGWGYLATPITLNEVSYA